MWFYANTTEKTVLWSSWLWHLLYTQKVPSSILGRISCFSFFFFLFLARVSLARRPANNKKETTDRLFQYGCAVLLKTIEPALSKKKKKKTTCDRLLSFYFRSFFFYCYSISLYFCFLLSLALLPYIPTIASIPCSALAKEKETLTTPSAKSPKHRLESASAN